MALRPVFDAANAFIASLYDGWYPQAQSSEINNNLKEILARVNSVEDKVTRLSSVDVDRNRNAICHAPDQDKNTSCLLGKDMKQRVDKLIDHELLYTLPSQLKQTCKTFSNSSSKEPQHNDIAWLVLNAHIGKNADKSQIKINIWNQLQTDVDPNQKDQYKHQICDYIDNVLLKILNKKRYKQ
eukprot:132952_1